MSLADSDRELVVDELGREPTPAEAALFENLWSEHCAYRSSRPLLSAFDSEGEQVVGPGDDAAVVALPGSEDGDDSTDITMGIESHNLPLLRRPVRRGRDRRRRHRPGHALDGRVPDRAGRFAVLRRVRPRARERGEPEETY